MPGFSVQAVLAATILTIAITGCQSAPSPSPSPAPAAEREARTPDRVGTVDDRGPDSMREEPRGDRPRGQRGRSAGGSQPGTFDFYLLNLSWSPEFCATHSGSPECAAHPGFVVHGLWPQNANGTYPENCSNAPGPSNPGSYTDLLPTVSLIEHEWTTHGTCSGLSADAYFALIRRAFQQTHIPPPFTAAHQSQTMLSPDALLAEFSAANPSFPKGSLALSCGNNYLTAVEVCVDKNLHPEACQGVRSCRANVVKIVSR